MAARHAGFAMVTCVREGLVNNLIEAAFVNHPQQRDISIPTPLQVSGRTVVVAGDFRLLPPVVTLSGGRVGLLVRARLEARLSGGTTEPLDVLVELRSAVDVGLTTFVTHDHLQVGVDPGTVTISSLSLTVLDGSLPSIYGETLRMPEVAAAVQAAVRALPQSMLSATVDGFPVTTHVAPRQMPCGASLFELPEMFHAQFSISRVVPVVLEHVLVIGVDIAGITAGNPGALRSLFGDVRPVWVRTSGPEGVVDFGSRGVRFDGNLAVSVNPDAVRGILQGPISDASRRAFIDCHVALDGLSLSASTFTPNLQPQYRIDGLRLGVGARYYQSTGRDAQSRLVPAGDGTPVQVSVPFAVHFQTFDGPTDFLADRRDGEYWFLKVYEPDIDLPWWVTFGLLLLGIGLPVLALPVVTLLDGIIPGILSNVANQVQRNAQQGINGAFREFGLAPRSRSVSLPGLGATPGHASATWYAMDGEGIDVYSSLSIASQPDTRRAKNLRLTISGTEVRDGAVWESGAIHTSPIPITATVRPGVLDPFDPDVRWRWEVRRTDTKAVVLSQDLAKNSLLRVQVGGGGPSVTGIVIDRTDPAVAVLPGFEISVRVYRPLMGRTKEIGSADLTINIADRLDRTHPYVWWSGWAVGSYKESVLHRTATPGRCRMVDRAPPRTVFEYLDELPFPLEEIAGHRDADAVPDRHLKVCDYCFYGGPEKHQLLV